MPNRIIKDSICISDSIDRLSWFEEVFFYRLIVNCDDYGRMDARPAILKARLFPLKSVTESQITAVLNKLATAGMVKLYECDHKPYLQLTAWERHQTIRNHKSKYPAPDDCRELHANEINCTQMKSDAPVIQSNPIQSESKYESNTNPIETPKRAGFVPPTLDEIKAYCKERNNTVDAERFIDYYTAANWYRGKTKIKDWKACVRTWEKRQDAPQSKADRFDHLKRMAEKFAAEEQDEQHGCD